MLLKMKSFRKALNENGYAGLVETLVGSVIVLIAMGATAIAINAGLQATLQAKHTTKATNIVEQVFTDAKGMPYSTLSINTIGNANHNVQDVNLKDMTGCTTYSTQFENEDHIVSEKGIDYCKVIDSDNGEGVKFNVETHVTKITSNDIIKDLDGVFYDFDTSHFHAKRVSVKVSWFDGEFDANKIPIMRTVQSEIVITPGLGDCIPSTLSTNSTECG